MTKEHVCNKEVELTNMANNIDYIKKVIAGNGETGLIKKVNLNSDFRKIQESKAQTWNRVLGSGLLIQLIMIGILFYQAIG